MEKKNWAKRILALGTGALMLGATLTGALAATWDLADYPAPFVMDGQLDDTVLVVGKAAATADVLGAIDIAAALQADAVSETAVEVSSTVAPTSDEGLKIEKSGDKFNFGEDIFDVQATALDSNDLVLLADGTFEDNEGTNTGDTDYDQELWFGNVADVWQLEFEQPADNDNYEDGLPAGEYLHLTKNKWVYNYTLEFDSGISMTSSSTDNDLEGTTLDIQGNTYTITDATISTGAAPTKLKLVSGDSTMWLVQDQPYTLGSHTVTVVDVDAGETKCGVNVDGVTKWIDDGTTQEFGDLAVGVLDVVAVYTKDYDADTCELSLGSSEIELEDGEEVVINGNTLEGSYVDIMGTTTWTGLRIMYKVGDDSGINQDDIYLSAGQAWTDPVFGNFKVQFEGVTADYEDLNVDASGDDAFITFMNNDGKEVEIPFYFVSGDNVALGRDSDEELLLPGETYSGSPEGTLLLYTTSGGETHVLEIDDVTCSSSNNKTTIKDITYGTTPAKDFELTLDCADSAETISLGSLGSIKLNLTASSVEYIADASYGNGVPETMYEGTVRFKDSGDFKFNYTEKTAEESTEITASTISLNLTYDTTDERIEITAIKDDGSAFTWEDNDEADDDTKWAITSKGSLLEYDDEDKLWLNIQVPEADVYGNVFVLPLGAEVTSGGSGSVSADKVNPFSVGLAVLDEDAESMSKNMIIVGGPCANTIAAEVMGNPENCAEGFEAGKGMLKFFDRSGKAALLVAGFSADDTVGSAYVLADYNAYDMSGDEVEVVVTSLSEITVN